MDLLLTSEVATRLGCNDSQIRNLKHRNKDRLIENLHWQKSNDGRTLWTPQGVSVLASLINGDTVPSQVDTQPYQRHQTLQVWADQMALAAIEQQLPALIQASLNRILTDPTEQDALALAAMLDRIGEGLGLMQASQALAGGLRAAVDASRESLKLGGSISG